MLGEEIAVGAGVAIELAKLLRFLTCRFDDLDPGHCFGQPGIEVAELHPHRAGDWVELPHVKAQREPKGDGEDQSEPRATANRGSAMKMIGIQRPVNESRIRLIPGTTIWLN